MQSYKRNQVEEAIFRTLGAQGERAEEVRFRLKRLLVADRQVELDDAQRYAYFGQEPPGSGAEVMVLVVRLLVLLYLLKGDTEPIG